MASQYVNISTRLDEATLERVDAIVEHMRKTIPQGATVSRSGVLRMLLEVGMESMTAEVAEYERKLKDRTVVNDQLRKINAQRKAQSAGSEEQWAGPGPKLGPTGPKKAKGRR